MRKRAFFRFLSAGFATALFLCALIWSVGHIADHRSTEELRHGMLLLFARILESGPYRETMPQLISYRSGNPLFHSSLWIVNDQGEILAANTEQPLPKSWLSSPKPRHGHEFVYGAQVSTIRLKGADPAYLVLAGRRPGIFHRNRWDRTAWMFFILTAIVVGAFSLLFFYLRRKSSEAKKVLGRLEKGDLKARFQIQGIDAIGSLMLDFNRMADEIESLVGQLRTAESSRRTLIRELGHDLRTPLMSLQTSFDALVSDWKVMEPAHREQMLAVCQMEIAYFAELIDGLLFIAQMEEPRYRTEIERVDLPALLESQVRLYEIGGGVGDGSLKWIVRNQPHLQGASLLGDAQLLNRMIRNLLDNAARFAREQVTVGVKQKSGWLCVEVADDGPGMTPEEIEQYGKIRNRRMSKRGAGVRMSAGLGSVIVHRIVELHKGRIQIRSHGRATPPSPDGTVVEVWFPRSLPA